MNEEADAPWQLCGTPSKAELLRTKCPANSKAALWEDYNLGFLLFE